MASDTGIELLANWADAMEFANRHALPKPAEDELAKMLEDAWERGRDFERKHPQKPEAK